MLENLHSEVAEVRDITLKHFIYISKEILSTEALKEVNHFFEHDEFEMAFEGLAIELMGACTYPENFRFSEWKDLGIEYRLNEHSVFDGSFWRKFNQWGNAYALPE